MSDVAALKAALDAAEAAKQELVDERRANRPNMTKAEFAAYNAETYQKQLDVQAAVMSAQSELSAALNQARQELLLGTVSESEGGN